MLLQIFSFKSLISCEILHSRLFSLGGGLSRGGPPLASLITFFFFLFFACIAVCNGLNCMYGLRNNVFGLGHVIFLYETRSRDRVRSVI